MRVAFVLCSYGVVVTLGLVSLVSTREVHAWSDLSLTSIKTATALETPVDLQFDDVPLQAAVEALCEKASIDVVWDASCFAEGASVTDETVALSTPHPLALRQALALVLEPCYLTWEMQGADQLRIISRKQWNSEIVTETYDVRPILNSQPADFDLPGLIQKTVTPRDWQTGEKTVAGYMLLVDGELQVTQHRAAQQQVSALLAKLNSQQTDE